ncbi:unnamed protein product [Rotaria magnacalcarata]|uniref:Bromo domain-containing protein n=2 Tax=Rotaria magnacalcarata TaxID=392030 RepID=A0A819J8N9_9BILA|nr:unnamed protein product [Rotaria magnacalcarata]
MAFFKIKARDALHLCMLYRMRNRSSKKPIKFTDQSIQSIYTYSREYRENDIGLIAPFLELPSADEYPDYYETIKHPIDMSIIKDKMDKGMYKLEQNIIEDLNGMFHHVKVYNVAETSIFKYASRLEQALANKCKE